MDHSTYLYQQIDGFFNADYNVRTTAETNLQQWTLTEPDTLIRTLLLFLEDTSDRIPHDYKLQSAIYLRNLFRDSFQGNQLDMWGRVSPDTQQTLVNSLFPLLSVKNSANVTRNIADTIVDVGTTLYHKGQWNSLPESIVGVMAANDLALKGLGFYMGSQCLSTMARYFETGAVALVQHLGEICTVENMAANMDANLFGDVASFVFGVIARSKNEETVRLFGQLIPIMCEYLRLCAMYEKENDDDIHFRKVAEAFSDAVNAKAHMFVSVNDYLCGLCTELVTLDDMSENSRSIALELVADMVTHRPKSSTKNNSLRFMIGLFFTALALPEDPREWAATGIGGNSTNKIKNSAELQMDRVTCVFGEPAVREIFDQVPMLLNDSNWHKQVAGLCAITQTVEYLDEDEYPTALPFLVAGCCGLASSEVPQVRYQALKALAQISLDCVPWVQNNCLESILPVIVRSVQDTHPKTLAQAFCLFVNYCEELDRRLLEGCASHVMSEAIKILTNDARFFEDELYTPEERRVRLNGVREHAITAISVIGASLGTEFKEQVDYVIALMTQIITNAGPDAAEIKARAIESVSVLAYSCQVAFPQCHTICQTLAQVLASTTAGSPHYEYLIEAIRRMAGHMRSEFVVHINSLFTPILDSVCNSIMNIISTTESVDGTVNPAIYRSSNYKQARDDLDIIANTITYMGVGFQGHIDATIGKLATVLIQCPFIAIQGDIINIMYNILELLRLTNAPVDRVARLMTDVTDVFVHCVSQTMALDDPNLEYVDDIFTHYSNCLEEAGSVLEPISLQKIGLAINQAIGGSAARSQEVHQRVNLLTDDDERDEQLYALTIETNIRDSIAGLVGSVISVYGDAWNGLSELASGATMMLAPQCNVTDKMFGLTLISAFVHNLGDDVVSFVTSNLDSIFNCLQDSDSALAKRAIDVMADAYYHCGLAAGLNEVYPVLQRLATNPFGADRQEIRSMRDSAAIALLKIIIKHSGLFPNVVQEAHGVLESYFPIRRAHAAVRVHRMIADELEKGSFMGSDDLKFTLLKMFLIIYKTDLSDWETNRIIVNHYRDMLTPQLINDLQTQLTDEQKYGLQRLCAAI